MASDKEKRAELLDDFDLDTESLPEIDEDDPLSDPFEDPRGGADAEELETYGVWVKVKPVTVEEHPEAPADEPELSDLGEADEPELSDLGDEDTMITDEEEELLNELEERETPEDEDISDISDLPELSDEDESAVELTDLSESEVGEEEVEVPLSESTSIDEDFTALGAISKGGGSAETTGGSGASSETLQKIEAELSAIKGELSDLKNELSLLRKPSEREEEVSVQPVDTEQTGFFDEDEDETIALTGDELDNILNTADITEEGTQDSSLAEEDLDMEDLSAPEAEEAEETEEISLELPEEELGEAEETEELSLELPDEDLFAPEEAPTEGSETEELPSLESEGISLEIPEEEPSEAEAEEAEEVSLELAEEAVEELGEDIPELDELEESPAEEAEELESAEGAEEEIDLDSLELTDENEEDLMDLEDLGEAPSEDTAAAGAADTGEAEEAEEIDIETLETPEEAVEEIPLELEEEGLGGEAETFDLGAPEQPAETEPSGAPGGATDTSASLQDDVRTVLKYMDDLLESLPEEKIEEFAKSEYFELYRKLFDELGISK